MSAVEDIDWDSQAFGCRAGRVSDFNVVPSVNELATYDHVHVRIPMGLSESVWRYEALGFRYVLTDFEMHRANDPVQVPASPAGSLVMLRRQEPQFPIRGFSVEGSRFSLDPWIRTRLSPDYWDSLIANHCRTYADYSICALDEAGCLAGFASCLAIGSRLDIALLTVHPDHTGSRIGARLVSEAEKLASERSQLLTTHVVSTNLRAINFYFRCGFSVQSAEVVLHRIKS